MILGFFEHVFLFIWLLFDRKRIVSIPTVDSSKFMKCMYNTDINFILNIYEHFWTFLDMFEHVWTCFLSHTVCSSAVNEMFPWQASIKELETLSTNTKTHQKLWVNMFKHVWTCFLSHAAVNEMFSWQASIKELETLSTNTKTHQKVVGGHKASQII